MAQADSRDRPGKLYRDVILPEGMTHACLDGLARMFNDYMDGLLRSENNEEMDSPEAAVLAFNLVLLELERKEPLPSQRNA